MITKHSITFTIDDKEFKIVVNELTKEQQKELKKKSEQHVKVLEHINESTRKLTRLSEKYGLLKNAGRVDEALAVSDDIEKEEVSLLKEKESMKKSTDALETLYQDRLKMCVSGEDKDAFLNAIDDLGISINSVFEEIAKHILESKEKK